LKNNGWHLAYRLVGYFRGFGRATFLPAARATM
jgi:hypothetical protein